MLDADWDGQMGCSVLLVPRLSFQPCFFAGGFALERLEMTSSDTQEEPAMHTRWFRDKSGSTFLSTD